MNVQPGARRSRLLVFDRDRIGAIGHSSGGATVAMLAGGRFSPAAMAGYCASADAADRGCRYPGARSTGTSGDQPVSDARVKVVVLLDPAVGPGLEPGSMAGVVAPAMVVGSVANDFLPVAAHADRYAQLLPRAEVVRLTDGEGHFVYLNECALPLDAMGVPLCRDRDGVSRRAVHARLTDRILEFLRRHLPAPPERQ